MSGVRGRLTRSLGWRRASDIGTGSAPWGESRVSRTGLGEPDAVVEADILQASSAPSLQDGEVVLLALRPSRWLLGLRLGASLAVVVIVLVLTVQGFGGAGALGRVLGVSVVLAVVAWLPVAAWFMLDWRSHRYVLTNRRVLASVGMVRPFVAEAPLAAVLRVELLGGFWEWVPRIGTVRFVNPHELELVRWSFVSRPGEVRRTVLEALHRYGRGDVEG